MSSGVDVGASVPPVKLTITTVVAEALEMEEADNVAAFEYLVVSDCFTALTELERVDAVAPLVSMAAFE